ncbi:hypothetical protein GS896_25590 [Rhodococcus hoagii]|nr:hypothetical protein [Prescottella equi]MBM4654121.1 hypothetical protein [Prescottella equi]MBM4717746.1 hypothetical protein [Prescottella equi]MBM4719596.1 hypothetical protein [Prescottella equi]NKR23394.1 hypothetical protein [Prescottella equi]
MTVIDDLKKRLDDKTAVISLIGRRAMSGPNTYFAYEISYTAPDMSGYETVYVTTDIEYGYGDHWLNMATEKFAELTGIAVDRAYLDRWGRENGITVQASVEDVSSEAKLKAFIDDRTN